MTQNKRTVGIIGLGYWGPILLRNFQRNSQFEIIAVCDRNAGNREKVRPLVGDAPAFERTEDFFAHRTYDLVVVATNAKSHFALTEKALEHGANVFVEKPFCLSRDEGQALLQLARKCDRQIFIDHTYLFSANYLFFKEEFRKRFAGKKWILTSYRTDFGQFPNDCGVVDHLMYHDLYILNDLIGLKNLRVTKSFQTKSISPFHTDTAFAGFEDPHGNTLVVNCSLATSRKVRLYAVASEDGILEWDDMAAESPFRWIDKKITITDSKKAVVIDGGGHALVRSTTTSEPIASEINYIYESLTRPGEAINGGVQGFDVLEFIEKIV